MHSDNTRSQIELFEWFNRPWPVQRNKHPSKYEFTHPNDGWTCLVPIQIDNPYLIFLIVCDVFLFLGLLLLLFLFLPIFTLILGSARPIMRLFLRFLLLFFLFLPIFTLILGSARPIMRLFLRFLLLFLLSVFAFVFRAARATARNLQRYNSTSSSRLFVTRCTIEHIKCITL